MSDEAEAPKPCEKQPLREMTSEELLRGQNEVLIRHGEEIYRLKLTRNQKLILQK
ncbi:MAG: hemin uptake protein HemP [Planctomycetaceae bacterium]